MHGSAPRLQEAVHAALYETRASPTCTPQRKRRRCGAPRLQELVVAELCEVRAQALLVAHQEALAAQPEQVRECDACTAHMPDGARACGQPRETLLPRSIVRQALAARASPDLCNWQAHGAASLIALSWHCKHRKPARGLPC